MTSMRRNDVASTSFRRHVPNRFLINQCQIIAFLILKASTKFRIERNSFASTFKSKLHLLLFYASVWYICDFFLFHIEIEGKCGWIIGGGDQRVCWPPFSNYWGAWPPLPPLPLPTPMHWGGLMKSHSICVNEQKCIGILKHIYLESASSKISICSAAYHKSLTGRWFSTLGFLPTTSPFFVFLCLMNSSRTYFSLFCCQDVRVLA